MTAYLIAAALAVTVFAAGYGLMAAVKGPPRHRKPQTWRQWASSWWPRQ